MRFPLRSLVRGGLLLVLAGFVQPLQAQAPGDDSWTTTFRFENDLFAYTDRYYTNGLKLSWISPELKWFQQLEWLRERPRLTAWLESLVDFMPYSEDAQRRHVALSVGQQMYTPEDLTRSDLIVDDRPYAGWLFGGVAFHSKSERRLDTFEIQAGFTGPWSLAKHAQDLVHEIRGLDKARGWQHQIDTEPGVTFTYDVKYRLLPRHDFHGLWGVDSVVHAGGAVGNVATHLSSGMEVRIGWNIPTDFGTSLIRPAGDAKAPDEFAPAAARPEFSFHLFGACAGRVVMRDIFLDGSTFDDSHRVDKHTLVGDFMVGASMAWRGFEVTYAQVLRTREFEAQDSNQYFGSLSVSYTY